MIFLLEEQGSMNKDVKLCLKTFIDFNVCSISNCDQFETLSLSLYLPLSISSFWSCWCVSFTVYNFHRVCVFLSIHMCIFFLTDCPLYFYSLKHQLNETFHWLRGYNYFMRNASNPFIQNQPPSWSHTKVTKICLYK